MQNIDHRRRTFRTADTSLKPPSTIALVSLTPVRPMHTPRQMRDGFLPPHGMGASRVTDAQAAEQVPSAELHPRMAAGATGAAMVPNVAPAAA